MLDKCSSDNPRGCYCSDDVVIVVVIVDVVVFIYAVVAGVIIVAVHIVFRQLHLVAPGGYC